MSCGYLYEIQRKSEDVEDTQQRHNNLATFSEEEDDEIWEVPAESFDNAYRHVENEVDADDVKQKKNEKQLVSTASGEDIKTINPLNVLQNFEIFSAQKLRLSLSAEQISLKSQQQQWENSHKATLQQRINKSINTTEADVTWPMTVNTNNTSTNDLTTMNTSAACSSCVKWKNVKINKPNEENAKKQSPGELSVRLPSINISHQRMRRTSQTEISANMPVLKLNSTKHITSKTNPATCKEKQELPHTFSVGSVTVHRQLEDLASDCCVSPEILLDKILSEASAQSIQSSSLSSGILSEEAEISMCKNFNPFYLDGNTSSEGVTQSTLLEQITNEPLINQQKNYNIFHPFDNTRQPAIMITQASISSSSINNAAAATTSSESFETASTMSRKSSLLRNVNVMTHVELPQELLCNICHELFKDPRCLNCLHTFCLTCILDEQFKEDVESNPFWSCTPLQHPLKNPALQVESNPKVTSGIKACSASPDSNSECNISDSYMPERPVATTHKRPSFSFKLRRPSDNSIFKTKMTSIKAVADNTEFQQASNHNQPITNLSRSILCKTCQLITDVPMGGIRQLPQNLLIVRKIDEFKLKIAKEHESSCGLCYDKTSATHYCDTCSLKLCILCKESHERQKHTAQHLIKNILECKEESEKLSALSRDTNNFDLKCSLHQGFEIKSFCTICLQVACTDCLILQHKGHKHEPIANAIQCYSNILRDSTEQIRLICKSAEHSLEKINTFTLSINRKCDELEADVEDFMQRYFEAVEAHKTLLLQQIKRSRDTKLGIINEKQVELEKRTQEGQIAIKFSQELMEVATDVEILSFTKLLLKRFEHCQQFKEPIDSKITLTPNFLPNIQAPITKDHNDIPVYGIITMQTVEPSQCTLQWDGFSQLRLNKKVELTLISRDVDGQPMCHGGLKIQTHVKYKDINSKCLRMEVSDKSDGTYSIAFTPDLEGTLILMISVNEKHIKGSPFSFLARSVRPHTGVYHCCTFCSSKGNKFATCSCEGNMPGYSGCGHGHSGHPGRRHWSCCGSILRNSECNFSNRSLNPK